MASLGLGPREATEYLSSNGLLHADPRHRGWNRPVGSLHPTLADYFPDLPPQRTINSSPEQNRIFIFGKDPKKPYKFKNPLISKKTNMLTSPEGYSVVPLSKVRGFRSCYIDRDCPFPEKVTVHHSTIPSSITAGLD